MSRLVVQKFGGTSVGSPERIAEAARIVAGCVRAGDRVVVVTSAMSGVTSALVAAAERASGGAWSFDERAELEARHTAVIDALIADLVRRESVRSIIYRGLERIDTLCTGLSLVHELTPRLRDAISATGEMMSAPILAAVIEASGVRAEPVDASELIVTGAQFGDAEPDMTATAEKSGARLSAMLDAGIAPVVTGFIGATPEGVLTTLGRGGSDYSATILGAALGADEVWIWTDVDGVMTANPAEVPEARTMREISFSEASELAYYGAKVLHHKTILPVLEKGIPLRIRNSFRPEEPGTRVSVEGRPSPTGVKAVTAIRNVSLITIAGRGMQGIPGIAARAFTAVAAERANVLMISQASSENNICLVVRSEEAARVVEALRRALELDIIKKHIDDVRSDSSIAVIAAVGDRMAGAPGIAGKLFGALGASGLNVIAISQGSSELNISLVVSERDAAAAVRAIHDAFELGRAQ